MALIIETGQGVVNADSYTSVEQSDLIVAERGWSWGDADETAKERALRAATVWLDATYGRRLRGDKATSLQALRFPRITQPEEWVAFSVPTLILVATTLAATEQHAGRLISTEPNASEEASKRTKVGPIETERTFRLVPGGRRMRTTALVEIDTLMSRFVSGPSREVRLG